MISPYWEPVTESGGGLDIKKQDGQVMKAIKVPPVVRMEILTQSRNCRATGIALEILIRNHQSDSLQGGTKIIFKMCNDAPQSASALFIITQHRLRRP